MTAIDKARAFAALHVKGDPLVLYNIWDAGSARAVADAGAPALATGSWSVAAAQGYSDGEALPLDLLVTIVGRIAAAVDLPLSVDFEGGYAAAPQALSENTARIIAAGAVGVNFEDQKVGGEGLYPAEEQAGRIAAVRRAADEAGIPLYINARTDLFLKEKDRDRHPGLIDEAVARAALYRDAGASGFFVPGLLQPDLAGAVCAQVELPVNVLLMADTPGIGEMAAQGVARVSFGPKPYRDAVKAIGERYQAVRALIGTG